MIGLLIRHGHSEAVGRWLAGRRAGIALSDDGRRQAQELSRALRWAPLTAIYSSPLERAVQTAAPLAGVHHLPVRIRPALTDVDFGAWTGKTLDELAGDPSWEAFNSERRLACAPEGEALAHVQQRVMGELLRLARLHQAETIAIVTHAEPIRCAIAALRGATLDDVAAIEISPVYVSTVGISPTCRRVLDVNLRPEAAGV